MIVPANDNLQASATDLADTISTSDLVARGYDEVADQYLAQFGKSSVRSYWLDRVVERLSEGQSVLDLGCGAGPPVMTTLLQAGLNVTGVDVSKRQLQLARAAAPDAALIQADVSTLRLPAASFDAITAFYSLTHIPREEHRSIFERILSWLRPGGLFLASLGKTGTPAWTGEWLGTQMFFSHHDASWYEETLADLGFVLERAEPMTQDDEDGSFFWVLARKKG